MARAIWKGPFVDPNLIKKVEKMKDQINKSPIKLISDTDTDKTNIFKILNELINISKKTTPKHEPEIIPRIVPEYVFDGLILGNILGPLIKFPNKKEKMSVEQIIDNNHNI